MQGKMRSKIKYLILIAMLLSIGAAYLIQQNRAENNETNCVSCDSEKETSPESKIEITSPQTFTDALVFSAVATTNDSSVKYFNWKPENPCPGKQDCHMNNITAKVTFLNAGDLLVVSKEGDAYIQIANNQESNCINPEQATFTKYIAYSPAMNGGASKTEDTCGKSVGRNTCVLTPADGFDGGANCFSLKLFSPSVNEGEINFATILLSLTYTWSWDNKNETQ